MEHEQNTKRKKNFSQFLPRNVANRCYAKTIFFNVTIIDQSILSLSRYQERKPWNSRNISSTALRFNIIRKMERFFGPGSKRVNPIEWQESRTLIFVGEERLIQTTCTSGRKDNWQVRKRTKHGGRRRRGWWWWWDNGWIQFRIDRRARSTWMNFRPASYNNSKPYKQRNSRPHTCRHTHTWSHVVGNKCAEARARSKRWSWAKKISERRKRNDKVFGGRIR